MVSNLAEKSCIGNVSPDSLKHNFTINYLRSNPERLVGLSTLLRNESLDTTAYLQYIANSTMILT